MTNYQIVIANWVNFFILVWLMAKFLYRPIINAMNEREKRIAANIKDAAEKADVATKEAETYRLKNAEFDKNREAELNKMREEIESLRKSMSAEVKSEVEELRKRWKDELDNERRSLAEDAKRVAAKQFSEFAVHVLKDLADETMEERIASKFVSRIENLSSEDKAKLASAVGAADSVSLRSSFALSKAAQDKIVAAVKKASGKDALDVEVKQSADVVCGIELDAGSWSVMWSLASYLDKFSEDLDGALDALSASASKAA